MRGSTHRDGCNFPDGVSSPSAANALAPAATRCIQRMRPALGTFCVIEAGGSAELLQAAIGSAFDAVSGVERVMHPNGPHSDLPQFATCTGGPLQIDATTWEVIALAQRIYEHSNGYFDPCLPTAPGCMGDIELLTDNKVICHRPVAMDLGGIAKGYAVDRAVAALRAAGCEFGMVNAGGDLRVFGHQSQTIFIALEGQQQTSLRVHDRALAVSDALAINHPAEYRGYYSRNSNGSRRYQQAVIAASTAAVADALTKCALLCEAPVLRQLLGQFEGELILLQ